MPSSPDGENYLIPGREQITVNSPRDYTGIASTLDRLAELEHAAELRAWEQFEQMQIDARRASEEHAAKVARPIAEVLREQRVRP